ncbi:hypothetical protein H6H01_02060 [Nostoc calcicola FACHB-3891]|nr:hypothetical protein [Nostoc calcicola FACHB-3891]
MIVRNGCDRISSLQSNVTFIEVDIVLINLLYFQYHLLGYTTLWVSTFYVICRRWRSH